MGIDGTRGRWREEFNKDGEERIHRGRKEGRKDDERMRVLVQIVRMCYSSITDLTVSKDTKKL